MPTPKKPVAKNPVAKKPAYNPSTGFARHLEADPADRITQAQARYKSGMAAIQKDYAGGMATSQKIQKQGPLGVLPGNKVPASRRMGDTAGGMASDKAARVQTRAEKAQASLESREQGIVGQARGRQESMAAGMAEANERAGVRPPRNAPTKRKK